MSNPAVKPIPDGMHSLTPHLVCAGAADAMAFYKKAFNAVELSRLPGPQGKLMHASMRIGDAVFMLNDEFPEMGGFGPMPGQVHHFIALENEADRRYGLERYTKETRRLYGVADRRLAEVEFFAGAISIADFAILGWAWRHERHQVDLADFPNVKRWYETMMARPATKRGFDVALS